MRADDPAGAADLLPPLPPFVAAGLSRAAPGGQRPNQDCFRIVAEIGLLLLADGMGGLAEGEVASRLACDTVVATLLADRAWDMDPVRAASLALSAANAAIHARQRATGGGHTMGTTLVGLLAPPGGRRGAALFHVGDSRFYLCREGQLIRMTRDHTARQDWLDAGGVGSAPPNPRLLRRALGPRALVTPEVRLWVPNPGDRLLLCSDGVSNILDDGTLRRLLTPGHAPAALVEAILSATEADARDDATAIVAEVAARPGPA